MKKILLSILSVFYLCSFGQSRIKIVEFYNVRNAEFGYNYNLPTETGKEIIGKSKDYEIAIYNSNVGNYQINIFSEKYFERNEQIHEFNKYFEKIRKAEHTELKNAEISSSKVDFEKKIFIIYGKKGNRKFIWKSIISEIPVSGEFGFNTIIFFYENTIKNKKIGLKLIEKFGQK
ncbi:hypothetical protein [Flavobacterium sp. DSR3-2]|uniref:hypothetical protein n=1 Tax=Flavobacterium sp. DSR3-2 TaxID=2804634 RepID=UPI003CEA9A4C